MQQRQINTRDALKNNVERLLSAIEKPLKEKGVPTQQLLIINDLYNLIKENEPFEAKLIISAIQKNLHLFEEYKSFFSSETPYEWLLQIAAIYRNEIKQNNAALESLMPSFFDPDTKRLDVWLQKNDPSVLTQMYLGQNSNYLGKSPLEYALDNRVSPAVVEWLIKAGADISLNEGTAALLKQGFDSENFQKLNIIFQHILQNNKAQEVGKWIILNQLDQIYSPDKFSFLHFLATTTWNASISSIIKLFNHAAISEVNKFGHTPLDIAVLNGNVNFVKAFSKMPDIPEQTRNIARVKKSSHESGKKIFSILKEPYAQKKSSIIAKKAIYPRAELSLPANPVRAICSQIYYEGDKLLLSKPFVLKLSTFVDFKKAPLIAPLLYVVGLGALGRHQQGLTSTKPKFLKSVFTTDPEIKRLIFHPRLSDESEVRGAYKGKSTIFVALGDAPETIRENISSFFHEMTHFVALEVMQNNFEPYHKEDEKGKQIYLGVIQNTYDRVIQIGQNVNKKTTFFNPQEMEAFSKFQNVFESYEKSKWGLEIIVLLPQTIAILGYEKGCHFVETYFPEYFNFYKDHFYPQCLSYLNEKGVQDLLEVQEVFLREIQASVSQVPSEKGPNF